MLIKSVEVRNYRTLRHAKVALTTGLNVIHGDNDIGKSTLMEAIRSGLVRPGRLTGKWLTSMCSRDGGHPEVDLCFELDGDEYDVRKKFGANGSTRLFQRHSGGVLREVPGDADEELTRLLRFGERRTSGGITDLGILPLIWVKQGASGLPPNEVVSGEPSTALAERLAEVGGSPFDGAGTEPLAALVRAEYDRYFTPGRGEAKAGSPLVLAREARKNAETEVTELRRRRTELEALFAERQQRERERRAVADRLPVLEKALEKASAAWELARSLLAQRTTATAEAKVRQLQAKAACDRLTRRRSTRQEIDTLLVTLKNATQATKDAAEQLLRHDTGREDVAHQVDAALAAERTAEQGMRLAQARVELLQESRALDTLNAHLTEAEAIERDLAKLQEQLGEMRIQPKDLDRLGRLERDAENAAATLKAMAVNVEIVAHRDAPISIDAKSSKLRAGQRLSHQAAARTVVRVGDLAEVIVTPGGSDLATAREAAAGKAAAFQQALAKASIKSLAEARSAVEARRAVEGEIAVAKAKLGAVAPSGVPALREEHAAQRAKTKAAQSVVGGAESALPSSAGVDEARAAAKVADRAHQTARRAWEQAQAVLARHDAQRAALLSAREVADSQTTGARVQLANLEEAHARSVTNDGADAVLEHHVLIAETAATEADRLRAALDEQVTENDPKVAENRAEAAARARNGARADSVRLEKEIHGLDTRLDQAEGLDVDDLLDTAEVKLAKASEAETRRAEEAEGVKLLHETLGGCRSDAQARFLAPLTSEVQRLARQLDPTSKVALDAQYRVELERAAFGTHGFDSLGGGCKEQIATVVRLAMARILAGNGVLPVLFDDAMVNTSDARFDRMANVLLGMASQLQIIVFTCHWDRYAALGAHNTIELGRVRAQFEVPARAVATL